MMVKKSRIHFSDPEETDSSEDGEERRWIGGGEEMGDPRVIHLPIG